MVTNTGVCRPYACLQSTILRLCRLGSTLLSAYTLAFQTHVYSTFPPSFAHGFKALIASTFSLVNSSSPPPWALPPEPAPGAPPSRPDLPLWSACDTLGLLDRYESLIASVCYEYIETHVVEVCRKKWDELVEQGQAGLN